MFSDRDATEVYEFPSDWRKTLSLSTSGCQTEPASSKEGEAQTNTSQDAAVQTVEAGKGAEAVEAAAKRLNSPSLVRSWSSMWYIC